MKILVTGHRGFIGSHVYEHLTELGFDVDGYDIPCDIGDFKTNKKYDVVIHLAANAAIREALKDPDAFWENNVVKSKPIFVLISSIFKSLDSPSFWNIHLG